MSSPINAYGDRLVQAGQGHGADIASQRADDLDLMAVARIEELVASGIPAMALDLGSGRGAQAVRLLRAGATRSVAVDMEDFGQAFLALVGERGRDKASFIQMDLGREDFGAEIRKTVGIAAFDVIVCQRTIHYFPWEVARNFFTQVATLLAPGGRLYVSASGLGSELGVGYQDAAKAAPERFSRLAPAMATKHGILAPVCLHTRDDLVAQCSTAGLNVLSAQESAFGNIKVAAEKR